MSVGAALARVETPVGVVDLGRARDNARRVASHCRRHGLTWRPHVKTHKSVEIARLQLEAGARGLAVATPREAEAMAAASDDLLLAHPPASAAKIRRLLALPPRVRLRVALDSLAALEPLAAAGAEAGREFGILVEADAGLGRTGVATPAAAVALAAAADSLPGARFDGLMFYPGHVRVPRSEQSAPLERLSRRLDAFLAALRAAGLDPDVVSGGSTPTLWDSQRIEGLTEIRSGTCIYNDRDMVALAAASWDQLAYTVLATVVSVAVPGQAVVDAGSKALAKEALATVPGYGALLDRPDVVVKAVNEEHGMLDLGGTTWRPAVGDQVRIAPNHVCVSVNLQDRLWGVERGGESARPVSLDARGRRPAPAARTRLAVEGRT